MSKTVEERYDEIKKEIWQISESYMLIKQNRNKSKTIKQILDDDESRPNPRYEQRHILLLQMRLNNLIKELNSLSAAGEITIPLLWKNIVNNLRMNLVENCGGEYQEEISKDIKLNQYLF